jgi:hypothetical protein
MRVSFCVASTGSYRDTINLSGRGLVAAVLNEALEPGEKV